MKYAQFSRHEALEAWKSANSGSYYCIVDSIPADYIAGILISFGCKPMSFLEEEGRNLPNTHDGVK